MSDKSGNIDDLIRNGFDSSDEGFDFDSWSSMEKKLNANVDIDTQIVEAFNQFSDDLPTSVWPEIQEELDINTVWKRIAKKLEKKKRRAIIWWNIAGIILLLVFAGYLFKDEFISVNQSEDSVELKENISEVDSGDITSKEGSEIVDNISSKERELQNPESFSSNSTMSLVDRQEGFVVRSTNVSLDKDIRDDNNNTTSFQKENSFIELLERTSVEPVVQLGYEQGMPNIELPVPGKNKNLHPRKWIVGGFGAVDNGLISDATTRSAFSANSINSNNFTLSTNYGLYGQFYTQKNYFVQAEFYLNSRIKRSTQEYQHFQYLNHSLKLDYCQLSLSFGKSIPLGKSNHIWFNPDIGLFGGYLKYSNEYVDDVLISNNTSHKKWNYGVQVDLGIQHEFNRFVVGYGLHSNFGLANIFQGTEKQSSFLNVSQTFSNGVYLKLGFKI
ncbi:hypothetical protein K6119_16285 [Paracrocinitomix mangrovi]|uniref:hypothetical protein n=1 Tax=Paracrocinitomix mangrovi TaxID=2862509 RepID=UPI001C8E95A9|nr:hypothetical protein [Paracrocinitomix mangrovi]UKN01287.1 hypothetical protein K6119_16285 [Paracrocinitomix mangrovi]